MDILLNIALLQEHLDHLDTPYLYKHFEIIAVIEIFCISDEKVLELDETYVSVSTCLKSDILPCGPAKNLIIRELLSNKFIVKGIALLKPT